MSTLFATFFVCTSLQFILFYFNWKTLNAEPDLNGIYSYEDVLYFGPLKNVDWWKLVGIAVQ